MRSVLLKYYNKDSNYFHISLMIFIIACIYISVLTCKLWLKWDMYGGTFPISVSLSNALKHGELPLWEPFQYRGVPMGNLLGFPTWSPFTIVFGLIGYNLVLLQFQYMFLIFFAAIFTYLSIDNHVSNKWLCCIGGIAYATSGLFVSNAEHLTFISAAAIFPLLYFSYTKWIKSLSFNWAIVIGVSLALLILNNYPPFIMLSVLFIFIDFLFAIPSLLARYKFKQLLILVLRDILVVVATSGLFGLVGIISILQVINEITREKLTYEVATSSSLTYWNWFSSLSPVIPQIKSKLIQNVDISMNNTYVALPIIILAFSILPRRIKEIGLWFQIIFSFLICLGKNTILFKILYLVLPGISASRFPTGFRYFFFFYLIILVSLNTELIFNNIKLLKKMRKIFWIFVYVLGTISLFLIIQRLFEIPSIDMPKKIISEFVLSTIILTAFTSSIIFLYKKNVLYISLLILVICFSSLAVLRNGKFTIGAPQKPEDYNELIKNIYKSEVSYVPNEYVKPKPVALADTVFTRRFQTGGYVGNFYLKNFESALRNKLLPNEGDPAIWAITNSDILEDESNHKITIKERAAKKILNTQLLVKSNDISVTLNANESSFVILEQSNFSGWKVLVDNQPSQLYSTNSGVMGVKVNKGQHHITFIFKPISTIVSAYITFSFWIILLIYFLITLIRKRNQRLILVDSI